MANAIRSAVIGVGLLPNSALVTLLTVPAGVSYIIKDVNLVNTTAAAQTVTLLVARPGVVSVYLINESLNTGASIHRAFGTVVTAGDAVGIQCATSGVQYWVSGTRLQGVAIFP